MAGSIRAKPRRCGCHACRHLTRTPLPLPAPPAETENRSRSTTC